MIGDMSGAIIIAPITTAAEFCSSPTAATMLDKNIKTENRANAALLGTTIRSSMIDRRSSI